MSGSGPEAGTPPAGRPLRQAERQAIRDARVGRLATLDAWGRPSIVPFCFALIDTPEPVVVSVLDEKPKRVADADLGRVRNIERQPEVAFIVDHYVEEWSHLWFVQVRGQAAVLSPGDNWHREAIAALRDKYPQYREMAIDARMVIAIAGLRGSSWHAAGSPALSET